MMKQNENIVSRWCMTLTVVFVLMLLATGFGLAWPKMLKAGPTLPPRADRFPPTVTPMSTDDDDDDEVVGAYIELQVPELNATWSWVEWQDGLETWHRVDGWQGQVSVEGYRVWWVAEKDFGTGPFRWVVLQGAGQILGISDPFYLPRAGERLIVTNSQTNAIESKNLHFWRPQSVKMEIDNKAHE